MVHPKNAAASWFRLVYTLFIVAGIISLAGGCSSYYDLKRKTAKITKKTGRKITELSQFKFSDDGMKKKVIVGPVVNKTPFSSKDFGAAFQKDLADYLGKKCTSATFINKEDPAYPAQLARLPRKASGRIDNFELARIGRQLGLNTVVTGSVIDIREYTEERGIMWFRDTHKFLQVLVNLVAYDTDTGAKLGDESYMYETELDLIEFDDLASSKEDLIPVIDVAVADAADSLGDVICAAVRWQPWTGYITTVEGNRVEISSGSGAGLSVGQVLSVFDRGTVIRGAQNQQFIKPGGKIGEIKITKAYLNHSLAENISDQALSAGSAVRPK